MTLRKETEKKKGKKKGSFVSKIVLTCCENFFSSDRGKTFANSWPSAPNLQTFSTSQEQSIGTVKGQNNF